VTLYNLWIKSGVTACSPKATGPYSTLMYQYTFSVDSVAVYLDASATRTRETVNRANKVDERVDLLGNRV